MYMDHHTILNCELLIASAGGNWNNGRCWTRRRKLYNTYMFFKDLENWIICTETCAKHWLEDTKSKEVTGCSATCSRHAVTKTKVYSYSSTISRCIYILSLLNWNMMPSPADTHRMLFRTVVCYNTQEKLQSCEATVNIVPVPLLAPPIHNWFAYTFISCVPM